MSSGSSAAPFVLGFLGGAVAGALVAFTLRNGDPRSAAGAAAPSSEARTSESSSPSLDALASDVRRIRELLENGTDISGDRSQRSTAPAGEPATLERKLDELIAALSARASTHERGSDANESLAELAAASTGSRDPLWAQAGSTPESILPFRDAHRFWTYARVLRTYGPPDWISPGDKGEIMWQYADPPARRGAWFKFLDGYVVECASYVN